MNELTIFTVAYFSFLLSAVCGGGAGLILIPILGIFLPIQFVPATLTIGTFTSSGSRIFVFFRCIRFDIVRWFVPPAVVSVWLGAWLIKYINPVFMEVLIGIILVSNLPFLFKKDSDLEIEAMPSKIKLGIIGFLAGFVSGITGAVGLLFNKIYLRCGMTKEEIVATRAANEIILHLIKLILYASFGLINNKSITFGIAIALAAIISAWSMKKVLSCVNEIVFKKIGYLAMFISGVLLLTKSTTSIVSENRASISLIPLQNGIDAKLSWQREKFSLEFTIDEGFEIEQIIPITDLTSEQRKKILKTKNEFSADEMIVKVIYGFYKQSYEIYFFKDAELVHKIQIY